IMVDANGDPLRLDLVEPAIEAGKTRVGMNVANPRHYKLVPGEQEERPVPGQRGTLGGVGPAREEAACGLGRIPRESSRVSSPNRSASRSCGSTAGRPASASAVRPARSP